MRQTVQLFPYRQSQLIQSLGETKQLTHDRSFRLTSQLITLHDHEPSILSMQFQQITLSEIKEILLFLDLQRAATSELMKPVNLDLLHPGTSDQIREHLSLSKLK